MDRRDALTALVALTLSPRCAEAQQTGKSYRIAYMGNSSPSLEPALVAAFLTGLREQGYVEGRNLKIDYFWAEGRYARFPALVAAAIKLNPDVIVTAGTPATLAAKKGTGTIPIVMAVIADPVGIDVVPSLARPGGNVTGSATMLHELAGKRLELLQTLVPGVSHISAIWNPANPANAKLIRELQAAARFLRIRIDPLVDGGTDIEIDKGFSAIVAAHPQALIVEPDRALLARRVRIVEFAEAHRLPTVYPYREYVELGGLASYAPSFPALFRRAGVYIDKILKGTKPGDLPIEQPTTFELIVNMKTAKSLGITVPTSVLARADQVIQ